MKPSLYLITKRHFCCCSCCRMVENVAKIENCAKTLLLSPERDGNLTFIESQSRLWGVGRSLCLIIKFDCKQTIKWINKNFQSSALKKTKLIT